MSDATLECLERSFNIWVEMRKDFITLLEKKKKDKTQKSLGTERGTLHPALTAQWQIWSISQPLLQVTSRHDLFSFL